MALSMPEKKAGFAAHAAICIRAKILNRFFLTNRKNMESNVVPIKAVEDFPLQAISDIVIVEQLTEEVTSGGIFLPGDEAKFPSGRVVAVGPGRIYSTFLDAAGHTQHGHLVPTALKVGDWVIFGRYNSGGEPISLNGKQYLLCRENDIAAVSISGDPLKVRLNPNPAR